VQPSIDEIGSGILEKPDCINVETDLAKSITLNSEWSVNYNTNSITLKIGKVATRFGESLLIPPDVPNRHIRNVRKVGTAIFNLKRFDNLELYKVCNPQALSLALRGKESRLFANDEDALLWCSQGDDDFAFSEVSAKEVSFAIMTDLSEKEATKKAQLNSALIRTEVLSILLQASVGIRALSKLSRMLKNGVQSQTLEELWEEGYEYDDMANEVRQFIHEKEKKTKKKKSSKSSS
jgi:hypothetical protein